MSVNSSVIYFAKPEEKMLLDLSEFKENTSVVMEGFDVLMVKFTNINVLIVSGDKQGAEFDLKFINFLTVLQPSCVILCGICASQSKNEGKVIIGTKSRLMSGKLKGTDISDLELDSSQSDDVYLMGSIMSVIKESDDVIYGEYLQSPFVLEMSIEGLLERFKKTSRKTNAIDMESWYFMNATKHILGSVFPVVKGVSDSGTGKSDNNHPACVNKSFQCALKVLCLYAKKRGEISGRTEVGVALVPEIERQTKRARTDSKRITFSIKKLEDMELPDLDFNFIKIELRDIKYKDLGVQKYKAIHKHISKEGKALLDNKFNLTIVDE